MKVNILFIVLFVMMISSGLADDVRGPFGILKFPEDYTSKRVSAQEWIGARQTITLGEMTGEGCLKHFWGTFHDAIRTSTLGQSLILRVYTDGNDYPDVEVPFAAFFGHFHQKKMGEIRSPLMRVTDMGGCNSYFPMPFSNGMKVTLENETDKSFDVYFQGDYHQYQPGSLKEKRRFYARYRRQNPGDRYRTPYLAGFGRGEGFLAGLAIGMTVSDKSDGWYHNGGDMVLLDGETNSPSILNGIGGEDFFGNAYGMGVYSNGPVGCPYYILEDHAPTFLDFSEDISKADDDLSKQPYLRFGAYRHYLAAPIRFHDSFALYFGAYKNDISSVLYWYQSGFEIDSYTPLLSKEKRRIKALVSSADLSQPVRELNWSLCGPFALEAKEDFDQPEVPESSIDYSWRQPADFGFYQIAREKGWSDMQTRWVRKVPSVQSFLNFRPYFHTQGPTNFAFPKNTSAYAYTVIQSEEETTKTLRLGYDDPIRLWINGKMVFEGKQHLGFYSEEIKVGFKKGENEVLVKVGNLENQNLRAWVIQFQLVD
jgi:Protein of unknown function (DUF2961)